MNDFPFSEDVLDLNPGLAKASVSVSASKYKNVKEVVHGMRFDSGKEAAGVAGLILLEEQKKIFALRLQVRFPVADKITYIADAVYLDEHLEPHIIDFKGFASKEYKLKRKLFKQRYGKDIEEC